MNVTIYNLNLFIQHALVNLDMEIEHILYVNLYVRSIYNIKEGATLCFLTHSKCLWSVI